MQHLSAIAQWAREAIGANQFLAPARPYLAQTPDWVLLGAPALVALALLWACFRPRRANGVRAVKAQATPPRESAPPSEQLPQTRSHDALTVDEYDARAVRVFASSTFLDMQRERDILVKEIFPTLRARMRTRGVELVAVDLRWGITREQAERGETLPILMSEIDRCRPYFVGFLGDRYGWTPPESAITEELKATFPSIADATLRSVTEMEFVHGVLTNADTARRAFLFERASEWNWRAQLSDAERDAIAPDTESDRAKLQMLKDAVRSSGARLERYRDPAEMGAKLLQALGDALDQRFPERQAPDGFTQAARLHAAYARERRGLHIGAAQYQARLDQWSSSQTEPSILVTGASGGGKSTLIANWIHARRRARSNDIVFEHYIGASPDSADPMLILRRLWEHLARATGESNDLPEGADRLMMFSKALSARLERACAVASAKGGTVVVALDGLDKLSSEQTLHWLPDAAGVKLVASSLDGEAKSAALARGWRTLEIHPLDSAQRGAFIAQTLAGWGRNLLDHQIAAILANPLSGSPLFLRTVLDELRVSATNAILEKRLAFYLGASDMADVFQRMLDRLEHDCGAKFVKSALSLIWASRGGLEESELLGMSEATPLDWALLRNALADSLRDQVGKLDFSHDFFRQAVQTRYVASNEERRSTHAVIAQSYFSRARDPAKRGALAPRVWADLLYQLRMAERWDHVSACLEETDVFSLLAPASYGFTFAPYLSGVDGSLPVWNDDPDALTPALAGKLTSALSPAIAWSMANAFAQHALNRIEAVSALEKAAALPSNKIRATLEQRDRAQYESYRNLMYSAARLAGFGPTLLVARFGIIAESNRVSGVIDQDFIEQGQAFFARYDKVHRFVRYLADLARGDGWSGALEDNFAGPARDAWALLETAVAGKSRPPVEFLKMSEVGYPIGKPQTFETNFGGTWLKDAGRDGFLVRDTDISGAKLFYFAPMDDNGAPPGYRSASESARTSNPEAP